MTDWANIPSVILIKILSYLSNRDRILCSTICKEWYNAVNCGLPWRNFEVYLDADLTDPMTLLVTKKYASHIKNLNLAWSRSYIPRRWIRNRIASIAEDTCNYLSLLQASKVVLLSLKITDWYFASKVRKIIHQLILFMRTQKSLRYLDVSGAQLDKGDIMKILNSCRNSNDSMRTLVLNGAVQEWHNLFYNMNYEPEEMFVFSKLEVLKLDYSSFTESLMLAILSSDNHHLKYLEINIKDCDNRSHYISQKTWQNISEWSQRLKVTFHIYNLCHYEDIYYILCDCIPLSCFTLTCGPFWNQSRSRNYCGLISLLTLNYSQTLSRVILHLKNNREMLDYYIYELLKQCKNLVHFEFDGVLRKVDFFKQVCELQLSNIQRNFKYLHVRPRNTSIFNNVLLSEIWRNNVNDMSNIGIHFEIETFNSTAVRIFC